MHPLFQEILSPYVQPDWAKDEPSMLKTIPNRRIELDEKCPEHGLNLVGLYEADTNGVVDVVCPAPRCNYEGVA